VVRAALGAARAALCGRRDAASGAARNYALGAARETLAPQADRVPDNARTPRVAIQAPSAPMSLPPSPNVACVLVAAGESTRMGGVEANGARKPLLRLAGRPLIEHACAAFDAVGSVGAIVIVAHRDDVEALERLARESPALAKVARVVAGGAQRTDSVRLGVEQVGPASEIVLVHDAARPLIAPATIERAIEVAAREGAALTAIRVSDTLKSSSDGRRASATLDRSTVWAAQTPQAFRAQLLRELLERAQRDGFTPTDDAALYERYVGPIALVEGERSNLKVTVPEDLAVAEAILALRAQKQRGRA
jgi:2-C-methyl-D-erythritol 4-phosphate cytidylyltransferase